MTKLNLTLLGKRLKLELSTLLYTPFVLILFLSVCIQIIPVILYRGFVSLLAKCFRKDLTHIMHSTNSWTALENIKERPKSNIVVCFIFQGDASKQFEPIRSLVSQVVEKKRENIGDKHANTNTNTNTTSDFMYPELKQTWTSFMGYFFWKNEPNFHVNDHVRICDFVGKDGWKIPEICGEKDLQELATRLVSAPWKKDFSPWEVLLVPKFVYPQGENRVGEGNDYSGIMFRFHHSLGDGKGWLQIILEDFIQYKEPFLPESHGSKSHRKLNVSRLLLSPLKLPYDTAKNIVESYETSDSSVNPWHKPGKRSKEYFSSVSPSIPVQVVKDLKNKFGVSYATILISVISGGIRRVMKEAGQNVPKNMKGMIVLPMPRHPGGLVVHATIIHLTWPVGTQDPLTRLKQVDDDIKSKQSSLFPVAGFFGLKIGGLFPNFVKRWFYNKLLCTLGATLFPGPMTAPEFLGLATIDGFVMVGLAPGQTGSCITSVVINGQQRVVVTIDKTLFPSPDIFQKLGGFIQDEIQSLIRLKPEICHQKKDASEIV